MANADVTGTGIAIPYGLERLGVMKGRFNAAETPIGATELAKVIKVPAGVQVLAAWFVVVSPETGNATARFELGNTADTDGFVTAAVCTPAGIHPFNGAYLGSGLAAASTDGTIDLTSSVAVFTNVVVDVYALVLDLRG